MRPKERGGEHRQEDRYAQAINPQRARSPNTTLPPPPSLVPSHTTHPPGNLNTQDPNWLKIVLSNGKACGYLWEANAHYYPYINNATVTADELLSQSLQNVGLDRLAAYRKIAQEGHGLQLRISEANSL